MEGESGQFYRYLGYLRMRPCLDRLWTRFGAGSSTVSHPIRSWSRGGDLHSVVSTSKRRPRIEADYSCRWRKYSEQPMSPLGCIQWQFKFTYPWCYQFRSSKSPGNKLHIGWLIYGPNFCFDMEQQRNARMRMDILPIRIQLRHALQ